MIAAMRELAGRTLPGGRGVQVVYYQASSNSSMTTCTPRCRRPARGSRTTSTGARARAPRTPTTSSPSRPRPPRSGATTPTGRQSVRGPKPQTGHNWNQPADACASKTSAKWLFNGRKCLDIARLFANQGSARAPTDPPAFFQSLALYAPDWTMYAGLNENTDPRAPRDVFQAVDSCSGRAPVPTPVGRGLQARAAGPERRLGARGAALGPQPGAVLYPLQYR